MAIFVNRETRVIVQGISGKAGRFHAEQCLHYGTKVVGGVTPGKGGQHILDLPVFDTVWEAQKTQGFPSSSALRKGFRCETCSR